MSHLITRYDETIMSSNLDRPLYEVKAGLFKGLAHPLRIRILEVLADGESHSVGELQTVTGLEASHVSQHLIVLRRHRLVESERRGSHVFYRITHPEVAELLRTARELLAAVLSADAARIDSMSALPALPTR